LLSSIFDGSPAKFVPKTIKINGVRGQATNRSASGPPKEKMPERRATHDFVPWWNARHRRIHHHQPVGFYRVTGGHRAYATVCANVMPNDRSTIDTELSKNGPDYRLLVFFLS